MTGAIPPSSFVLLSSFAIQIGNVLAKQSLDSLGSLGVAFVLKAVSAIFLLLLWRPRIQHYGARHYLLLALLGIASATMSMGFFLAIARLPLGVVSAIDFLGPLTVAVLGSRRPLDFVWIVAAATGIMLLSPMSGATFDPLGLCFALLAGAAWAIYIMLSAQAGQLFPGGSGLALSMVVTALVLLPFGFWQAGTALLHPIVWVGGLGVALIGVVIPYSLEYEAVKQVPPRVFGVLLSIEPAIASLVGFLFLGEALGYRALLAIVLITMAAIGATLYGRR